MVRTIGYSSLSVAPKLVMQRAALINFTYLKHGFKSIKKIQLLLIENIKIHSNEPNIQPFNSLSLD